MNEYISREDVLKAFKLIAKNPNKDYQRGMQDTIDCLVPEVIADIPSADVQPVKHGYWKKEEPRALKCSVCGEYAPMNYLGQNCIDSSYCPWCGARMDAEPDEPWQSE